MQLINIFCTVYIVDFQTLKALINNSTGPTTITTKIIYKKAENHIESRRIKMKFTCSQQVLSKALNTVSKAVSTRTTIPILKGILIEADENGKIRLAASDLDLSIEKITDAEVSEAGSVVVQSKLFGDIIRKLPSEDITIEASDDNRVLIKNSRSEFVIVGLAADEFPSFGETEEDAEEILLDKEIFREMIGKTAFSASIDESKGIITGVLTEISGEKMTMVALDGFRMAVTREACKNSADKKFIISAKIMNELSKIIADTESEDDMKLLVGSKKAMALFKDTKVVIRLLEGEFIKYNDIIPKEHKIRITVARNELLDAIERASLLAKEGKNNLVRIKLEEDMLIISSRSEEGNVREECMISKEGDYLEIGFNSKYVSDVIKSIDDEEIAMEFNANINPCLVKPLSGDAYEYLILPVRITGSN